MIDISFSTTKAQVKAAIPKIFLSRSIASSKSISSSIGSIYIGGIDSPVAAYMMAKRGLQLHAIHFVSPPYTSDRALQKVETLCEKVSEYTGRIQFYCVPFTDIELYVPLLVVSKVQSQMPLAHLEPAVRWALFWDVLE